MPQVIFLPHAEHCPDGMVVEAETGKSILEVAHDNHIEIESACGGVFGGANHAQLQLRRLCGPARITEDAQARRNSGAWVTSRR